MSTLFCKGHKICVMVVLTPKGALSDENVLMKFFNFVGEQFCFSSLFVWIFFYGQRPQELCKCLFWPPRSVSAQKHFIKNPSIFVASNFAFHIFCIGYFGWLKATKLFILVIMTHNLTCQGAQRASYNLFKAMSPLKELQG